jgi:hypothetical protein
MFLSLKKVSHKLRRIAMKKAAPKIKTVGRPPKPGGKDPTYAIRISPVWIGQIDKWAKSIGITRGAAVRQLIEAGWDKLHQRPRRIKNSE